MRSLGERADGCMGKGDRVPGEKVCRHALCGGRVGIRNWLPKWFMRTQYGRLVTALAKYGSRKIKSKRGNGGTPALGEETAKIWCRGPESNWLRPPFQGGALPMSYPGFSTTYEWAKLDVS